MAEGGGGAVAGAGLHVTVVIPSPLILHPANGEWILRTTGRWRISKLTILNKRSRRLV